ncbi:ferredoxin [candidate division KSB3 bacterium]|uniref:Ferredoxin n=1 Tax=candidate division KSB3 bacterium TaxID=2044937 RepID=A0A2G6KG13_9BACT|nr:MAG: ferredoxin [candidate division KSB3 bacterium]
MALKLHNLKGVTPEIEAALKSLELNDSDKLLDAAGQPKDRTKLAEKLGIEARALLEILNRADLGRIWGIGNVYADLLEFSGVDTVMELRSRKPENLCKKMEELAAEHDVKRPPSLEEVQRWVGEAKTLERAIFY